MFEKIVAWIPHCSTYLPNVDDKEVVKDNLCLSDVLVDKLYPYLDNTIKGYYSRFACDLERYMDNSKESMFKVGMGVFYTRMSSGKEWDRSLVGSDEYFKRYYYQMHNLLREKIDEIGDGCLLLDLHSFNSKPLPCDQCQEDNRPDICIGTNIELPANLVGSIKKLGLESGWNISFNTPYGGSMTSDTSTRYSSVMIEVNKDLYLINNNLKSDYYKTVHYLKLLVGLLYKNLSY